MTIHENSLLKKENIKILIYEILKELKENFPWLVFEIAQALQDRLGKENAFVKSTLSKILDAASLKELDDYIADCPDNSLSLADIETKLFSNTNYPHLAELFNQVNDGLHASITESCLPWDLEISKTAEDSLGSAKTKSIRNIKMKLEEIRILEPYISKNKADFINEDIALKIIIEYLTPEK